MIVGGEKKGLDRVEQGCIIVWVERKGLGQVEQGCITFGVERQKRLGEIW